MFFITLILLTFGTINAKINYNHERNIIWNVFNNSGGAKSIIHIHEWRNEHRNKILKKLLNLPQSIKDVLIARADYENTREYDVSKVSDYLEYAINGIRNNFEKRNNDFRIQLTNLIIGELLTQNGTYIQQIIDGIWFLCEQSTWVLPAHIVVQKDGHYLPHPEDHYIDLIAAEVSVTMAYIKLLLGDTLKHISKIFLKRIDYELNRRIVEPYINHYDWWWMGFNNHNLVNNWNSWINTNMLQTALLAVDDATKRNQMITKSVKSIDKFINNYPDDGGCDEGPSYWEFAGGKFIQYLDMITSVSNGHMNWSEDALIDRIGSYIYKMHIDSNRFVNFADSFAFLTPPSDKLLMYGMLFNDEKMYNFAAYIEDLKNNSIITSTDGLGSLSMFINQLFAYSIFKKITPKAPQLKENFLNDLQVLTLRPHEGNAKGLFFAAKGGHNGESHNHNDVGNFILYIDGKPAIIDIGVGQYTKQTFGPNRYKLWNMQSQYHNCPTINGIMQKEGSHFRATDVNFTRNGEEHVFSMDIAKAYPQEAEVYNWIRKFYFNESNNTLRLEEIYNLTSWKYPFAIHFMTNLNHTQLYSHEIRLSDLNDVNSLSLSLTFDDQLFGVMFENKDTNDTRIFSVWGNTVTRITFIPKIKKQLLRGRFEFLFKIINM